MSNRDINRILREKYRHNSGPRRLSGRRPKFTREQVARLIADRNAGRSIMSLAREHRTSQSVIARYVRYGFEPARWSA
jgi:response regulator of citrate/malate metabolism